MNDDIHSLIGAYAIDAVTERERAAFDDHLSACAHCRDELAGLLEAAAHLGGSARHDPPPELRDAVLTQIRAVRPLPPAVPDDSNRPDEDTAPADGTRRRHVTRRWIAAAAAAAAIVIGGVTWHPWTDSAPTQVSAVQQVLHASDAHRHVKHLDGATATVVYSPSLGKSVLVARDMAPAPRGHTYQIWYLTSAGKATSAGFVAPHPGSTTDRVLLKGDANDAATVGVTVEPDGGSPQPTTQPIMVVPLRA